VNGYNLIMNLVNVAILKEKLSYYLNLVKSGEGDGNRSVKRPTLDGVSGKFR